MPKPTSILPGCYPLAEGLLISGSVSFPPALTPDVLARLAQAGVRAVITLASVEQAVAAGADALFDLCVEDQDRPSGDTTLPVVVESVSWPLVNHALPGTASLRATLDLMDKLRRTRSTVLVHGAGNPRRTTVAAGCWLARHGFGDPTTVQGLFQRLERATGGDIGLLLSLSDAQRQLIFCWRAGQ